MKLNKYSILTFDGLPWTEAHIDGLVQDCSNSSALAMELLPSCTKPSIYAYILFVYESIGLY